LEILTVDRWKEDGKLSPYYVTNVKGDIAQAFDNIIALESQQQ
jgi:hypothetical protein